MTEMSPQPQPTLSFVMIVLNGMPFLECVLKSVYRSAHDIVIIEGAVENCMFAANPDGSSCDGTVEAIRSFPDPQGKIRLIQGKWAEKLEMQNHALQFTTGDYIWLVDADEVYKEEDIERLRAVLARDPGIARVDVTLDNFWKGFDYIFDSDKFAESEFHCRRVFRNYPGARFTTHRPPTMAVQEGRVLSAPETRALNVYPYHYSYVLWSQVYQKVELYHRYGWGKQWELDLDAWYRDFFLQWRPERRAELESRYPVWTGDPDSRTVPFTGEHPPAVAELVARYRGGDPGPAAVSEAEAARVIGAPVFRKMALRALEQVYLAGGARERYGLDSGGNGREGEPYWDRQIALAFLAAMLRPERYLEVGSGNSGSMIQVLHNASPSYLLGVDPSLSRDVRKLLADYRRGAGCDARVRHRRGSGRSIMERLVSQGESFDLISISGGRPREDVWNDLASAAALVADRGAIVFDGINHPGHRELYSLCHRFMLRYQHFKLLLNSTQGDGCAIFLKGGSVEELLGRGLRLAARSVRVAGEEQQAQETTLTSIDTHSSFAESIRAVFEKARPTRIIETGTFHGEGTTRIIASCLRDLGLDDARFYSIECNPENHRIAGENLAQAGLAARVQLVHGLSVPGRLLPSRDVIREKLVYNLNGKAGYVDHDAAVRTQRYLAETDFAGIEEARLDHCLALLDGAPDFVLLDSGGHMGNIEFNYLVERLYAPCYIALDDINHVKHARSFRQMQKDPRFTMAVAAPEKFGFCIARFVPAGSGARPRRLLWIRTDAIGDSIISLPALARIAAADPAAWITVLCQEHVAELYDACPFVDEVITFERRRAYDDARYRNTIVALLRELQADLCVTPVLSREALTDCFALGSGARERVAFSGNDCNLPAETLRQNNRHYTKLVQIAEEAGGRESASHPMLLSALGIASDHLEPAVWLTPEDRDVAERLLHEHQLDPARTVAFFPGAQHSYREGLEYRAALQEFCTRHGFAVLALGGVTDSAIIGSNTPDAPVRLVDLSGKTTIRQACALIARCALAVGAESGLAHAAAAVGTPHVVLLGGGHFGRFMPYAATTTAAVLPLECFGCNWKCRYPRHHCIGGVGSRTIAVAMELSLAPAGPHPRIVAQGSSCWPAGEGMPRWDLAALRGLDLAVAVTLVEQDGTRSEFVQEPQAHGAVAPPAGLPPAGPAELSELLTRWGLEASIPPSRYLPELWSRRKQEGGAVVAVRRGLAYLKRWRQEQMP
ncbi:class I SAM-dependent methyltransferase [Geomonas paludis]|uniref:Class I SAM-dependent methyltransferase n=1 Tax=Geomonas paludis TaxID=2740185 RepID=A0A6V8MW03_9BACT|nr:class I SAM-dependent methyltransferase [Geomonas paludis]UPU34380.1 class I SAM-dependent methyltransferase [Geomonas paludis]GFO64365.1 hypothetical protein GMPD_22840 [Geomonas paludis]